MVKTRSGSEISKKKREVKSSTATSVTGGREEGDVVTVHVWDEAGSDCPAAKRVAVGHATALAGLTLQLVMQFAGKNEGIFIAGVCKSWKDSYTSAFDNRIRTHRAAGMTNLLRVHWIWSPWSSNNKRSSITTTRSSSLHLGKYAPRAVVEAAVLDESLTIDSEQLLRGVAASGRLWLLRALWDDHIESGSGTIRLAPARLGIVAAAHGHVPILAMVWRDLAEEHASFCGKRSAIAASRAGYVRILEFLSLSDWWTGENVPTNLSAVAAAQNQLQVLRWLTEHGHGLDSGVALAAAFGANVTTLDFLLDNGCPGMDEDFVACCVKHDRIEALQWCYDTLRIRTPEVWTEEDLQEWLLLAGHCDQKGSAKFLLEHGALWPNIGRRFGNGIQYHFHCSESMFLYHSTTCIWSVSFMEWAMAEGCTLDTWTVTTCSRLLKKTNWDNPENCRLFKAVAFAHSHECPCGCPQNVPDF